MQLATQFQEKNYFTLEKIGISPTHSLDKDKYKHLFLLLLHFLYHIMRHKGEFLINIHTVSS